MQCYTHTSMCKTSSIIFLFVIKYLPLFSFLFFKIHILIYTFELSLARRQRNLKENTFSNFACYDKYDIVFYYKRSLVVYEKTF